MQITDEHVFFASVQAKFQSGNIGKMIKSFDGGKTWIVKKAPESSIQAIGFVSPSHGWMGGHTTGFIETFDGGNNWIKSGLGHNLNRIIFLNDSLAYSAGEGIYKYEEIDTTASQDNTTLIPKQPVQFTVAPNPVLDKLNIYAQFRYKDNLTIDLYNSSGQLVKRLMRDLSPTPGLKKYTFDFSYPPGIYFLDFHYNNGRQSIKIIK